MIDAAPALDALIPQIVVDAAVSRQVDQGLALLSQLAMVGQLSTTIVWHLGTNGAFNSTQLDELLQIAHGRPIVIVTDHCGYCAWTSPNNATIASGCVAARRCSIADWNTLANAHPGWFAPDGVHMAIGGVGARAYAQLVASHL
jgi:hypothetical protein